MILPDCENPTYLKNEDMFVRCGKCELCRISQRSEWTLRLQLENVMTADSSFVTLTYDDEHLLSPFLQKDDLQKFVKRVRKHHSVRYFASGEYGELFKRPHWHIIFFGLKYDVDISKYWTYGFTTISPLTWDRCNYTCGYVQKKLDEDDGLYKVLKFQSLKPGIGDAYYQANKDELRYKTFIAFRGRRYPMPRYFRKLLERDYPGYMDFCKEQALLNQENELKEKGYDDFTAMVSIQEIFESEKDCNHQRCIDLKREREIYLEKKKLKKRGGSYAD